MGFLVALLLHGTGRLTRAGHELHASLLHVHLQGGDELAAVVALDELVLDGQSGTEHLSLLWGDLRLADAFGDADAGGGHVGNLVGLAVDADEGGGYLTRGLVHQVHDSAEVASLLQGFLLLWGELVTLVLIELLLLADEVGNETHVAVVVLAEGEAGIEAERLSSEVGRDTHEVGLAVVEHLLQVAGLLQLLTLHAPVLFQSLPVDAAFVNGLVTTLPLLVLLFVLLCILLHVFLLFCCLSASSFLLGIVQARLGLCSSFVRRFHVFLFLGFYIVRLILFLLLIFLCLLFLRHLFFVGRGVHLVGREQFGIGHRIFQQLLHHAEQALRLVCRDAVETEAAGFLALPEEVTEEIVEHVAVLVELEEILCVLHLWRCAFWGAVRL